MHSLLRNPSAIGVCLILALALPTACSAPLPAAAPLPQPKVTVQNTSAGQTQVQAIELDNCGGKGPAQRTEDRYSEVNASISAEIAATFGVDVKAVSAEVRAAVGASLGSVMGRKTSITLEAPPGTRMAFQLVWIGDEQVGIVQNLASVQQPIAFSVVIPTDVRIKSSYDIGCPEAAGQQAPSSSDSTSSSKPVPTSSNKEAAKAMSLARFAVDAAIPDNTTGIVVQQGDVVRIERLEGTWTGEDGKQPANAGCGFQWQDPDRAHQYPVDPGTGAGAALIGRIGDDLFVVSCPTFTHIAGSSGQLVLGMNDCTGCYWDNKGVLFVRVSVAPNGQ